MKYNQIRCFIRRGVELKVVPWNYNYLTESEDSFDGLFISNGPGDPTVMSETISHLRLDLQKMSRPKPIFGICLGHQLLALAAGASTSKMKYGNRGQNIPCTDSITGRCYITSQNHGFQVNADSLPSGWTELYKNANDESNEGIYHTSLPYFSVQFHPESTPGPRDTEFLFDVFIDKIEETLRTGELTPISTIRKPSLSNGVVANEPTKKPSGGTPRKVMILGSGKLVNLTTLDLKLSKPLKRKEYTPSSSIPTLQRLRLRRDSLIKCISSPSLQILYVGSFDMNIRTGFT